MGVGVVAGASARTFISNSSERRSRGARLWSVCSRPGRPARLETNSGSGRAIDPASAGPLAMESLACPRRPGPASGPVEPLGLIKSPKPLMKKQAVKRHHHKHNLRHRYEFLETLGKGTYGKVKKARESSGRLVSAAPARGAGLGAGRETPVSAADTSVCASVCMREPPTRTGGRGARRRLRPAPACAGS